MFDEYYYISAGKYRRYHGESMVAKLLDVKTMWFNFRDIFRLGKGMVESYFLLKKLRPSSVLLKGGYVCVPVGFGASKSGAFIITHDSDTVPGLANKLVSRYASVHATGMPVELYNYPKDKIFYTGVPINNLYRTYSANEVRFLKEKYSIDSNRRVVLVMGGSLGAERLNNLIAQITQSLISKANAYLICITGRDKAKKFSRVAGQSEYLYVVEFTSELFEYTAMADLVIARAGATAMAELAHQKKTVLLVPNTDLPGGHQLENAKYYQKIDAVEMVKESEINEVGPIYLEKKVVKLLDDQSRSKQLAKNLAAAVPEDPAGTLARLLIDRKIPHKQ